jgi:hypothetical protein
LRICDIPILCHPRLVSAAGHPSTIGAGPASAARDPIVSLSVRIAVIWRA